MNGEISRINDEIVRLEQYMLTVEIGSREYIVASNMIAKLRSQQLEYINSEVSAAKEQHETRRTVLTVIGSVVAGVVTGVIGIVSSSIIEDKRHEHTIAQIDELCNFERDDTFSGSKKTLASKLIK